MADKVRLDKWLWAVRLYKTRQQATDACRLNRVETGGQPGKAAREVRVGDVYVVKGADMTRTVKVLATAGMRMAAKLVPEAMEDLTLPEELARAKKEREERRLGAAGPVFPAGLGRPTKQQRRELERWQLENGAGAEEE